MTSQTLSPLIAAMRQKHGRDLSVYDDAFLAHSLHGRMDAVSVADLAAYIERLSEDPAEVQALLQSLIVSYSEFFRNPLTFALLEQRVLPELIEAREKSGRTELRIWSAGCAAGQEAYSVAILLDELACAMQRHVPFRIIATDISQTELDRARHGVYDAIALQNLRLRHLHKYFSREGETYILTPRLRERVDFSIYDLMDPHSTSPPASIYGDFDLVLCGNVLLYYEPESRRFILNKARHSLRPHGCFVTGETERDFVTNVGGFREIVSSTAVFQAIP